jgi:hypothetical protein
MTVLTDEQFDLLELHLKSAGLHKKGLYNDLLDHYYCLTTFYMEKGYPFRESSMMAYKELAPNGFNEIEQELNIFLTINIQMRMNRILYSGALVAAIGQTVYILFKTLRWPGAIPALMIGCFALFLMVVPVLLIRFTTSAKRYTLSDRFRYFSGLAGICLFAMGTVFKVMHWPSANIQIILGTALLALLFFPLFFWQQYKISTEEAIQTRIA